MKLRINNNQELNFEGGKYIGQVLDGLPDGRGIFFTNNGIDSKVIGKKE